MSVVTCRADCGCGPLDCHLATPTSQVGEHHVSWRIGGVTPIRAEIDCHAPTGAPCRDAATHLRLGQDGLGCAYTTVMLIASDDHVADSYDGPVTDLRAGPIVFTERDEGDFVTWRYASEPDAGEPS